MKTITLVCETCGKNFEKEKKEYNRRTSLGKTRFYCSLSCSGKSPGNIDHINNNRSSYPVWKLNNPSVEDEYSMFRPILKTIRSRIKERPRDFDLTLKHLKDVWDLQKGRCPFTGFDLELRAYSNKKDKPLSIRSASLDRIDNSKGYVIDNVRWVSVMFNFARNKFTDQDVIDFAAAVINTTGGELESTC